MGKTIGREPSWQSAHKRKDGSYVNEEAEEIGVNKLITFHCVHFQTFFFSLLWN